MAGMEQLEVHSRSYLVRYVHVQAGNTISWSIQPHKKSLNFGIFKYTGDQTPGLPSSGSFQQASAPAELPVLNRKVSRGDTTGRSDSLIEQLQEKKLKKVSWHGRCEGEKVSTGKHDVAEGQGGMYGLVFDNTFSKQVSKTAMFVLMTYPTATPPKSMHNLHFSQAGGSTPSVGTKASPALKAQSDSVESFHPDHRLELKEGRPRSARSSSTKLVQDALGSTFYTGVLAKKRRKKNQGHARRFFSLDYTSSTLSYYRNRHSSALRGSLPLSLTTISFEERRREINIDSGAEVWHMKALNRKDFDAWKSALERAQQAAGPLMSPDAPDKENIWGSSRVADPAEDQEWVRAEALVGRVSGIRDAVRRLAKDTDPRYLPSLSGVSSGAATVNGNGTPSPSDADKDSIESYFGADDARKQQGRLPFWKRKPSSGSPNPSNMLRRSVSAQLAVPQSSNVPPVHTAPISLPKRQQVQKHLRVDEGIHDHCMALLNDLDAVVEDFATLVNQSRRRRTVGLQPTRSRDSIASDSSTDEFFDAPDGDANRSQVLTIRHDSDDDTDGQFDNVSEGESDDSSQRDGLGAFDRQPREGQALLFPSKAKSLTPLPLDKISRRTVVPPAKVNPPSLIGFLRKNVGKDLSTIAMPVSANEPTSLLQRVAEQLEYSQILDAAAADTDATKRLLHVTAFAVSSFSNSRVKERSIRKPFNPMLGETFELVREDKGFRLLAEKISHRPVRMACQAEAAGWTFLQSPMPVQKFWGKSMELNTDGRARVFLHAHGEQYSWTLATSFLRNIIAGDKYVEPVGSMTVVCETSGAKAVVTFKAGGMFAGRSEDVGVQAFDAHGEKLPWGLVGRWTSHLNLVDGTTDTGKAVWSAGSLVDNAPHRYGFTRFAAALNEVTKAEAERLPPTDSRLRPDQRAVEDGDLDRAEALKARLEERQRARRRVMEEHGEVWAPRWFVKTGVVEDGEEVWRLKTGKEGYWEERQRGEWSGVVDVFQ